MENRAFNLEVEQRDHRDEFPAAIDDPPSSKVIPYPPLVSVPLAVAREVQTKARRRRRRFFTFLKLELCAVALLGALLFAATSKSIADQGLALSARIGVLLNALAVAVIPVIFYGSIRPKYRTRRYRAR